MFPPTQRLLGSRRLAAGGHLRRRRLFPLPQRNADAMHAAGGGVFSAAASLVAAVSAAARIRSLHIGAHCLLAVSWPQALRASGQTVVHIEDKT